MRATFMIITASLRFGLSITGAGPLQAQAVVPLQALQAEKPVGRLRC